MSRAFPWVVVLAFLGSTVATHADEQDKWLLASKAVVRLPPSAFPQVPAPLRAHLTKIGCLIPQAYSRKEPHNVISGRFRNKDKTDWAVLCDINGVTKLLVFWEGVPTQMEELSRDDDPRAYLQGIGDGAIGYSHAIQTVNGAYIREHYEEYGGTEPPATIDHDGIDDAYLDKASVVLYWSKGKWVGLSGAD